MADKKPRWQTHFEQVSLETVKTVMRKGPVRVVREGPVAKTEPYSMPPARVKPRVG